MKKTILLIVAIIFFNFGASNGQCTLQDSINSTCAHCCNCEGTTHVYAWGGTLPYTYSWSNGRTNDTLIGLASGTYTVTITDSGGCVITDSIFVHSGPPVSGSQTNVLCYGGSTGSATIVVSGNYTYSWSPGGETTSSLSGLSAGNYTATVTNVDTSGCSGSLNFTISQPDSLYAGFNLCCDPYYPFILCADSFCYEVFPIAYGGTPPYTYNLTPPSGSPVCVTSQFTGSVTDANGCIYNFPAGSGEVYVGLSVRAQINSPVSCSGGNNGSATINWHTGGSFGELFTYSWSPGGGTNQTETNLSAGTYTITTAEPGNICPVISIIAITQPTPISLTADTINATTGNCDGSAWVYLSGGTAPYTYSWTGGLATDTITNQCAGYYCCTITDANGCIDSVCTNIETSTGTKQLIMDNEQLTIYPNPNDGKFTLQINNGKLIIDNERPLLEVYNVLGEKVYSELSIVNCQLLIDLSSQPNGVYFYRALYQNGGLIGEGKLIIQK